MCRGERDGEGITIACSSSDSVKERSAICISTLVMNIVSRKRLYAAVLIDDRYNKNPSLTYFLNMRPAPSTPFDDFHV